MKRRSLKRIGIPVFIVLALIAAGSVIAWNKRPAIERSLEQATLPAATTYQPTPPVAITSQPTKASPSTTPTPPSETSKQANLAVPFTMQAPHANWNDPYGEFCEEASVLMAMSYLKNQSIPNPDAVEQALLAIQAFEEKRFGYYQDTTAAETATIFKEYYHYNAVQLVQNPSIQDIKQAISKGKLVLVPAAGRDLGNPYFQQPGPLYHMLVIKGYTANNKFITNDPGTRHGADYLYSEATIMNALHDWRSDGNIELGKKVILVVG